MLLCHAMAQVGGDVADIEAGLVAKWDEGMRIEGEKLLRAPTSPPLVPTTAFTLCFALRYDQVPGGDHGEYIVELAEGVERGDDTVLAFWATPNGSLRVNVDGAPKLDLISGSENKTHWRHVVVSVKRDGKQAVASAWLDGIELVSQALKLTDLPWETLEPSRLVVMPTAALAKGQIANLRLYNRALTRPEILELAAMAPMTGLKTKLEPFTGSMKLMTEEVVAVLGGTEAVAMTEEGTMEALMLTQFPGSRVKVRSLAWEADTVFRQDRPMNFGGLKQQLVRSGATAAMLMFGRQECLEHGEAGLAEFRATLEKLVTLCVEVTPRLVLLEPPAFEGELTKHNTTLKKYAAVMAEVAKAHGALFEAQDDDLKPGSTRDGLNLTSAGAAQLGMCVAKLWGGDVKAPDERLKALIGEKNRLWHRYWRPANWAFLHGDRTAQPSSRDHVDSALRWFPSELEQFKPLIEAKENELWKLANELGGKLP